MATRRRSRAHPRAPEPAPKEFLSEGELLLPLVESVPMRPLRVEVAAAQGGILLEADEARAAGAVTPKLVRELRARMRAIRGVDPRDLADALRELDEALGVA